MRLGISSFLFTLLFNFTLSVLASPKLWNNLRSLEYPYVDSEKISPVLLFNSATRLFGMVESQPLTPISQGLGIRLSLWKVTRSRSEPCSRWQLSALSVLPVIQMSNLDEKRGFGSPFSHWNRGNRKTGGFYPFRSMFGIGYGNSSLSSPSTLRTGISSHIPISRNRAPKQVMLRLGGPRGLQDNYWWGADSSQSKYASRGIMIHGALPLRRKPNQIHPCFCYAININKGPHRYHQRVVGKVASASDSYRRIKGKRLRVRTFNQTFDTPAELSTRLLIGKLGIFLTSSGCPKPCLICQKNGISSIWDFWWPYGKMLSMKNGKTATLVE